MVDMIDLFAVLLKAEEEAANAKAALAEATNPLQIAVNQADQKVWDAWAAIEAEMKETGEYEVLLNGSVIDYKISWSTPRDRVKVDAEATPDDFVKIERKPMLKEIGEHLKSLQAEGKPLPNWASIEKGESKLKWAAVKKTAKA